MKRYATFAVFATLMVSLLIPSLASATNYQDWWWNPSQPGQGVNIGHQGNTIGAVWFLYDQTGGDMWVILSGVLVGNTVSGGLGRFTGPPLGPPFNPAQVSGTVVGSATLTFTNPNAAVLSYTVHGVSGTLNLTRFNVGPLPIAGAYIGGAVGSAVGCLNPANNGNQGYFAAYFVSTAFTTITVQEAYYAGGSCTAVGPFVRGGSKVFAAGTFSCTNGLGGTWFSNDITVTEDAFVALLTVQYTIGESCFIQARTGGLRF